MLIKKEADNSLRVVSVLILFSALIIIMRLFILQVLEYKYYSTLALSNHEIYKQLYPRRGSILLQDTREKIKEYPAAVNRQYYLLYAVPRDIPADQVGTTTNFLAGVLNYSPEEKNLLSVKLSKSGDPYEPIAKKISEEIKNQIESANLLGINTTGKEFRYYPEGDLAANVLGFTGQNENGDLSGRYGIEGFWDKSLTGKSGFLSGERGALGSLIPLADRTLKQAENGVDLLLTIDRNLQYKACQRLREGFDKYKAKSGALILMDPKTGAVLAMCSLPDFDPNNYSDAEDMSAYNNTAIFTPYEPGSVFKPIIMSVALDLGLVNPFTTYIDTGERIINGYKIHNALNKKYGLATMTNVLESSINTGMIWVEEKIGQDRFKEYVEKFGFGKKTGIGLNSEDEGDISSLSKSAEIYFANGSFGQGFTATPLQLATAYAALANGGRMPKPYIVDEVRYANGKIDKTEPQSEVVISPNADKLITAMLISVVEKGHSQKAKMGDYYVAAKTGTAQIAGRGGYSADDTNHTFIGYFPASDPKFVLLVKYEAPQANWAESTAAPVFKDVAKFALDYYGVPGDKK
ncbi:MAG: Peptidoglycan glycosyltransferase [Candidatus Magasanikbacteria bacterium GW2011_GWA2_40_10]|uniref:Peptidoglycan glycosyltransferase n=1 Tax=Candidatus Magasanikbacteria bacterium GW2011_GWA2_40_10 TaxID=1619037 RepID=A0A0G0TC03_9BACT|nr:MAG: Peptidoglycan glycosyltransferase [Candidatus Magasanikbacteria bacterium GW2011_GWA2_40_10]